MSEPRFRPASPRQLEFWDEMVGRSVNGTIFHTRAFLAYHGERFRASERWMIAESDGAILAAINYAEHAEHDIRVALSPYGASYGGFIFPDVPGYARAADLVTAFRRHLSEAGLAGFRLTHPIACCAEPSLDSVYFALLEAGCRSTSRDISSVMPLPAPDMIERTVSSRARRNARKAIGLGVQIDLAAPERDFWVPMHATFEKHAIAPTHSPAQLADLRARLGERISLCVAYLAGKPVAGICLFVINSRVVCSFYLCQTPEGASAQALSLLVLRCLESAARKGYHYFDLGTSSVAMQARPNIFRFKEGFAARGYFRETFEWKETS
ncbi:MAG: GNAT family N-acetyltransferase [Burkholderiales bacterium]|nr:GNAT family N-acetyltransferase [Burkholderiales bacterium]